MYRLSSTFYAAFAGFALFNCTLLVCVSPAHAQGEIQKEVPQWTNAVPVWNDTAIWAREQHNDPSQDTAFLRTQAVRGSLSARFVVQARELVAKGKYDQAIAAYKQSSRYGWVPYDEWGDLLEARNDHANALRAYREVMYGYGIVRDAKGLTVAAKSRRDWKDKTGRSLREAVAGNLLGEDLPTPGWVSPSVYMRYALLLVKNGRKEEIEEAVQVRQWCVDALDKGSGDVIKQHGWLATVFTAESVERDPSLFIAQAWTIIGLYDKTRRTDDYPPLVAITRFKKAVAARPDFAPAGIELADRYRYIGERYDEPAYLPLAAEAYNKAANVRISAGFNKAEESAVRDKAIAALKEMQAGQKSQNPVNY